VSEAVGTALLLLIGLSIVILNFGAGSPMERVVPDAGARRLVTGFLFGATGGSLALSPVGRVSGAHLNPVVTLGFWLWRKIDGRTAVEYVAAQLFGAVAGSLPLLAWGDMGRSVAFGATLPGAGWSLRAAFLGELAGTFVMVTLLAVFLGFRETRRFTPALFPFLYAVLVYVEAPISGTSTNPARSFGPAVISGEWQGWWIYLVAPVLGGVAATVATSALASRIVAAKLYHFDVDPRGVRRRRPRSRATE
jgi:aquaporin Z